MSSARIEKLKGLLARVEQRRGQPRLRAVASPAPLAVAPVSAEPEDEDELYAKTDPPPPLLLTEKKVAGVPDSALEDAMSLLDRSGPLEIEPLAEPITSRGEPIEHTRATVPNLAREPLIPRISELDSMVTHRPEARPSFPSTQVDVIPAAPPPMRSHAVREPTLRFDTGVQSTPQTQIQIGGGEPPTQAAPTAQAVTSEPPQPLAAPSQVLEPTPLSSAAAPARVVSAARSEAPKSFGELLELSLGLRPQ